MCFSAKASFISASFLVTIGVYLISKTRKDKKLVPFAATPLLFGIQQFCEGIVWLGIVHNVSPPLATAAMYGFIFFAGSWWPLWVPLALYQAERTFSSKKLLMITIVIGLITSVLYVISLITQPLSVENINHHLYYPQLSYPFGQATTIAQYISNTIPILYLLSTVFPFFLSTTRYTWLIGIVMGGACLTSQIFFNPSTASVWCFFAALASFLISITVFHYKKEKQ